MKSMNTVNAVQLFILVWTFTAFCQADDHISVSCENVTGTVRKEVTFTCSVSLISLKKSKCCITGYKFYDTKNNNYSEIKFQNSTKAICRDFPQDSCKQRNSFTCSFSSTTVMTGEFRFFIQTNQGKGSAEFTVNITAQRDIPTAVAGSGSENGFGSKNVVIAAVTGCFIFIIIIT